MAALIVLLHGDPARAARYGYAVAALQRAGHVVRAPEEHGHDFSHTQRGRRLRRAVAELDGDLAPERARHDLPVVALASGPGAALALGYAVAHPAALAGLILAGPLAQPAEAPLSALMHGFGAALLPDASPPRTPGEINPDPTVDIDYLTQPLTRLGAIPMSSAAGAARRADRIIDGLDTLTLETLLLWGTAEGLHPPGGAEHLLGALTHARLTRRSFDVAYGEVLGGPAREPVLETVLTWLEVTCG